MSVYIVSDKTIDVLVEGILIYSYVNMDTRDEIGQWLLDQNYESVNCRYGEDTPAHEYKFKELSEDIINNLNGSIIGCIDCYNYQACETEDYYESDIYHVLKDVKINMLNKLIKRQGGTIPWGID